MNTIYSVYTIATGLFSGVVHDCDAADLVHMLPEGCGVIEGRHDHLCRRVDLQTGAVVPWQPPAPADDEWLTWAWNPAAERWQSTATLASLKRDRIAPVLSAILAAEEVQARPLRELQVAGLLGQAAPAAAVARLQQIDADIQTLRSVRSAMTAATTESALAAITWP